jgi:ABC-type multidrug transport system fused ATPase/permease subunit
MLAPLRDLLGAVTASVSAFAAFGRIQDFLCLDERVDGRIFLESSKRAVPGRVDGQLYDQYPSIQINNGCFSWGQGDVLQDVNTTIGGSDQGSLTMVIGPVGSGKSNFLKSLLGEISCSKGCMNLTESNIAFCDQTPWLINATLRENVVAESGDFDEMWFDTVIGACDLITDFASFAKGADTIVGDNGVKLSGGQKQRVVSLLNCPARRFVLTRP